MKSHWYHVLPGTTRQIPCHISKERDTQKEIKTEETELTVEERNSQQQKNKEEKDTKSQNNTEAHLEKVIEEIKTEEVEFPNQEMDFNSRQSFSKWDDATVVERPCELKIAESFTSEHPFFRIRLREPHVHRIFILVSIALSRFFIIIPFIFSSFFFIH